MGMRRAGSVSLSAPRGLRQRSLGEVSGRELRPLLEEECAEWGRELFWDYSEVSEAVASGLDRYALTGRMLSDGNRPIAYCYSLLDADRAVVGAVFSSSTHRGVGLEEWLLDSVIGEAQGIAGHDRVECQTLFSTDTAAEGAFARAGFKSRARNYLVCDLSSPLPAPDSSVELQTLRRSDLQAAAMIVHESHRGSLDAVLNLTYAAPALCRGFVETLVLRGGCGRFCAEASFMAVGPEGPVGVILASHLSRTNGHICQVSVLSKCQTRGIGTALLLASLGAFRREGLSSASLSVTVENTRAFRLYTRLGFRLRKAFGAHAWVRPPAQLELPA
jgi:ribosomal protein S18 acetylase RimI-like enzyme